MALSTGEIVGIVIGSVVSVIFLYFIYLWISRMVRRRKVVSNSQQQQQQQQPVPIYIDPKQRSLQAQKIIEDKILKARNHQDLANLESNQEDYHIRQVKLIEKEKEEAISSGNTEELNQLEQDLTDQINRANEARNEAILESNKSSNLIQEAVSQTYANSEPRHPTFGLDNTTQRTYDMLKEVEPSKSKKSKKSKKPKSPFRKLLGKFSPKRKKK